MGTAPAKKRGPYRFSFHRMSARMESGTVRLMDSVATKLVFGNLAFDIVMNHNMGLESDH